MQNNSEDFFKEQKAAVQQLQRWRQIVINNVGRLLEQHVRVKPIGNDDDIFGAHTILVDFSLKNGFYSLPIYSWEKHVSVMVEKAEMEMRKTNPQARIHKGAPYYNIGICSFLLGDFDKAYSYFADAAHEDQLSGRGDGLHLLVGDHPLSKQALIKPLCDGLVPKWATDYQATTGKLLDDVEVVTLLVWLAKRRVDAFQVVISLHRFQRAMSRSKNDANQLFRVRAISDLVIVVESTLRRWQGAGVNGQLFNRLSDALKLKNEVLMSFNNFNTWFNDNWKKMKKHETPAAVNAVIVEGEKRFATSTSEAERAGIVSCITYLLRNSLLHVNEEALNLYNNPEVAVKTAGFVLATLRICKHAEDGTLGTLS